MKLKDLLKVMPKDVDVCIVDKRGTSLTVLVNHLEAEVKEVSYVGEGLLTIDLDTFFDDPRLVRLKAEIAQAEQDIADLDDEIAELYYEQARNLERYQRLLEAYAEIKGDC